jgi:hypothetical protein
MACRHCGTDAAPGAGACPACGRRLRSWLAEASTVVREVLAGATATTRGLRAGLLAAIGSAIVLPGLVTLALLALAVPSAAGLAVSALAAAMPVPRYTLVILWLDRHEREPSWLLATALVWGAAVASALAGVVSTAVEILILIRLGPQWAMLLAAPVWCVGLACLSPAD